MSTEQPEKDQTSLPPESEQPAPDQPGTEQPVAGPPDVDQSPVEESALQDAAVEEPDTELISSDVAPKLILEDAEPDTAPAPDLEAVEPEPPAQPPAASSLDLPSLELPNPAPPIVPPMRPVTPPAPPAPGPGNSGDYAEHSARAAYGQPSPQPAPQPTYTQPPYAESPYAQPQATQQPYPQQSAYPQAQYPAVPSSYGVAPGQQLNSIDENTWATAAHWSAILASAIGLGFLGPLLVMLIQGPKSARVRANAVESLNFEITFIIAMIVSVILLFAFVGIVGLIAFPIAWLVLRIVASVQTSNGRDYRYPVNIRMVK